MKIIVTSHNPVKVAATRRAFRAHFPDIEPELVPVSVDSGVSDQPMSDEESRRGARNRVAHAQALHPEADYWVGLEGGLEQVDGQLLASAWMVAMDRAGHIGEARTATLPLPPAVLALVGDGLELGAANDQVFGTHNSKQAGGAFGLLTDNRLTREGIYAQAMELALIPLVNPLWPG